MCICVWNTTCMTSTKIIALTSSVSKALSVCMTSTDITYCTDLQCVKGFISLCDHNLTCSVSKALSICVTMPLPAVYQRLYQSVWPCTDLQCVRGCINLLPCTDLQCVKGFINLCDHALTSSVSKALSVCVTMHWPQVCQAVSVCYHALTSSVSKALSICVTMHWPPVCQTLSVCVTNTNITYCTDLQCVEDFISLYEQYKYNLLHWPPVCQRLYQSVWPIQI